MRPSEQPCFRSLKSSTKGTKKRRTISLSIFKSSKKTNDKIPHGNAPDTRVKDRIKKEAIDRRLQAGSLQSLQEDVSERAVRELKVKENSTISLFKDAYRSAIGVSNTERERPLQEDFESRHLRRLKPVEDSAISLLEVASRSEISTERESSSQDFTERALSELNLEEDSAVSLFKDAYLSDMATSNTESEKSSRQEEAAQSTRVEKVGAHEYENLNRYSDHPIKFVVIGDEEVGKTYLLISYAEGIRPPADRYVPTDHSDYFTKQVAIERRTISAGFWDLSGSRDFSGERRNCYSDTKVVLICFAINNPDSFDSVRTRWQPEVIRHCPNSAVILVGTKADLRNDSERSISTRVGRRLSEEIGAIAYFECSAVTGEGVEAMFTAAFQVAVHRRSDFDFEPFDSASTEIESSLEVDRNRSASHSPTEKPTDEEPEEGGLDMAMGASSTVSSDPDAADKCEQAECAALNAVLVGDKAVGKTSLLNAAAEFGRQPDMCLTGSADCSTVITCDNRKLLVRLWDVSSAEPFDNLRLRRYYQGDVILICFSLIDHASFENVRARWHPEMSNYCHIAPIVLVGTKKDQRDDFETLDKLNQKRLAPISEMDGRRMASEIGAEEYVECSAHAGESVVQVFEIARKVWTRRSTDSQQQ